jgi:hypothetical protein
MTKQPFAGRNPEDTRGSNCSLCSQEAFTVDLRGLPDLQGHRSRVHWAKRHRHDRQWREAVGWAAKDWRLPAPFDFAHVVFTRFSSSEPDHDNLVASCKPLVDGLVDAGVLVDDSPRHVTCSYRWERAKRGEGHVRIAVWSELRVERAQVAALCDAGAERVIEELGALAGRGVVRIVRASEASPS